MTSAAFLPPEDLLGDPDENTEDEEVEDSADLAFDPDSDAGIEDDGEDPEDSEDILYLPESDLLAGFDLQWEDRPVKPVRQYKKKVELAWEEYLSLLTRPDNVGRTISVFSFSGEDARKTAAARARSIRARLVKTQPDLMYEIASEETDSEAPTYKVYATFIGPADEATLAHREEVRLAREENGRRVAASRTAAQSA